MSGLLAVLAGAATGVLSGFGIGGGTLLLLYMTLLAEIPQHLAQGINLLYFLPTAAAAMVHHRKNGYLHKDVLLPAMLTGSVLTALAALTATSMDMALLRRLFGAFLLFIGLSELFRKSK